jgi:riboflavin kinase/FMN adenylyltransferase
VPSTDRRSVVIPGNHDGVHRGHRALVDRALELARAKDLWTLALFFDPHPLAVLDPARAPTPLTTVARRVELLRSLGVDEVVVEPFDPALASLAADAFVRDHLVGRYRADAVVVGPDFRFGHKARGDTAMLASMGEELGFSLHLVGPVEHDGDRVSSTRVRELLANGEVGRAADLLVRYHDVGGRVVRGDARGRSIGFPTANLEVEPVLLPKDGVYAVAARVAGADEVFFGAANLGVRPTFAAGRSLEVHLLDFEGDLYDTDMRIAFVARLRGEQKFSGVDALVAQIVTDVTNARDASRRAQEEWLRWV